MTSLIGKKNVERQGLKLRLWSFSSTRRKIWPVCPVHRTRGKNMKRFGVAILFLTAIGRREAMCPSIGQCQDTRHRRPSGCRTRNKKK